MMTEMPLGLATWRSLVTSINTLLEVLGVKISLQWVQSQNEKKNWSRCIEPIFF